MISSKIQAQVLGIGRLTSSFVQIDFKFTHSKVSNSNVTVVIEKNVVEFKVAKNILYISVKGEHKKKYVRFLPINDSFSMEKLES